MCEGPPATSFTDTVIVCVPLGVPGFVIAGDEELQPEIAIKPLISNTSNTPERINCRLLRHSRLGENARQIMLAHAIPCSGPAIPRNIADVGAVVATVSVDVAAIPLAGVTEAGVNVHVTPLGSVPQENLTVPPYPPTGVTDSMIVAV